MWTPGILPYLVDIRYVSIIAWKDTLQAKWINHVHLKGINSWEYKSPYIASRSSRKLQGDRCLEKGIWHPNVVLGCLMLKACSLFQVPITGSSPNLHWTKLFGASEVCLKLSLLAGLPYLTDSQGQITKWKVIQDNRYVVCNQGVETRDHLFFSCAFLRSCRTLILSSDVRYRCIMLGFGLHRDVKLEVR